MGATGSAASSTTTGTITDRAVTGVDSVSLSNVPPEILKALENLPDSRPEIVKQAEAFLKESHQTPDKLSDHTVIDGLIHLIGLGEEGPGVEHL